MERRHLVGNPKSEPPVITGGQNQASAPPPRLFELSYLSTLRRRFNNKLIACTHLDQDRSAVLTVEPPIPRATSIRPVRSRNIANFLARRLSQQHHQSLLRHPRSNMLRIPLQRPCSPFVAESDTANKRDNKNGNAEAKT